MALTEKGKIALENIFKFYQEEERFTAKELTEKSGINIVGATLVSVIKDGYLGKDGTSPIRYYLTKGAMEQFNSRKPKTFIPYSLLEFENQKKLTYRELCQYLINKYGKVDGSFFCNENCRSENLKIKRGNEGLAIHHIKEDEHCMLGNKNVAINFPWEYQLGSNLVYCNKFEHLLLHMKIALEWTGENCSVVWGGAALELVGIGGVVNYIVPDIFQGYNTQLLFGRKPVYENIELFDFYNIVNDFLIAFKDSPMRIFTNAAKTLQNNLVNEGCDVLVEDFGFLEYLEQLSEG